MIGKLDGRRIRGGREGKGREGKGSEGDGYRHQVMDVGPLAPGESRRSAGL
jgi:hypothetical protein